MTSVFTLVDGRDPRGRKACLRGAIDDLQRLEAAIRRQAEELDEQAASTGDGEALLLAVEEAGALRVLAGRLEDVLDATLRRERGWVPPPA